MTFTAINIILLLFARVVEFDKVVIAVVMVMIVVMILIKVTGCDVSSNIVSITSIINVDNNGMF